MRKARLTVSQVDPWSVMKMSFLLSLAGGIVLIVCVWLMWLLLSNGDVFVSIDRTVGDIAGSGSTIRSSRSSRCAGSWASPSCSPSSRSSS